MPPKEKALLRVCYEVKEKISTKKRKINFSLNGLRKKKEEGDGVAFIFHFRE